MKKKYASNPDRYSFSIFAFLGRENLSVDRALPHENEDTAAWLGDLVSLGIVHQIMPAEGKLFSPISNSYWSGIISCGAGVVLANVIGRHWE